jgi:MYXO-CTERM domain-containing protein
MVLDNTGTLRWTPNAGHLVEGTYEFTLTAEDEDNSRTRQEVVITVRENVLPPWPPLAYPTGDEMVRILRPSIILENVDDPDGDALEYFIQVDRDICFCSPDLMESGPLAEGELVTQWQLPTELDPEAGLTPGLFYVRRWTFDGLDTSEKKDSLFQVDLSAEPEPEPPNDDSDDGCGCRVAGAPSTPASSALPLVGTALFLVVARRRRR